MMKGIDEGFYLGYFKIINAFIHENRPILKENEKNKKYIDK